MYNLFSSWRNKEELNLPQKKKSRKKIDTFVFAEKTNTRVLAEMSHLRKFSEREHWVEHINRPFVTEASNTDWNKTK